MRIKDKFEQLKDKNKKAFVAYVPFGFPDIGLSMDICLRLQNSGVDIIELGVPFSDPLADGPIIQRATSAAIEAGANLSVFFDTFGQFKDSFKIPVVIMSYFNPIFKFGIKKFFRNMNKLDISAITIVDLPLEESKEYLKEAQKYDLETVFFITPTTSQRRAVKIAKVSKGFIYYISVTGITGPRDLDYSCLEKDIRKIKKIIKTPVCVGFGIHNREQVARISKFSDGVIVGSEIVKFIEKNHKDRKFLEKLDRYIKSLIIK